MCPKNAARKSKKPRALSVNIGVRGAIKGGASAIDSGKSAIDSDAATIEYLASAIIIACDALIGDTKRHRDD